MKEWPCDVCRLIRSKVTENASFGGTLLLGSDSKQKGQRRDAGPVPAAADTRRYYCTALIMSKIGRYIATIMPPTITPSTTIMTGSMSDSSALTAASTSSS